MANPERKRVTLHPVKPDGSIDTSINLYPKTFVDGIVDRQGNEVEVQERLTAGENITIEDNVISATGGKSFGIYTTLEPVTYEDNRIIFELSNEDYEDILNNGYPLIKIIDCDEPNRTLLVLTLEGEYSQENYKGVLYIQNSSYMAYSAPLTRILELSKDIDSETQEVIYDLYCYETDLSVSISGEMYSTQQIYQQKEIVNKQNNSKTFLGFGGINLYTWGDSSHLFLDSYKPKEEMSQMPGFGIKGKLYDSQQDTTTVEYSVVFPTTNESSSIQNEVNTIALEETIPTFAIIANPITNLNGRVLTEYTYEEVIGLYSYYDIKHTNSQTHEDEILTVDQARLYMTRMTGTAFVPEYNYKNPRNSLFITAAGEFLKPQFDAQNGLRLYKIPSPFALKADTGTKLYKHHITIIKEILVILKLFLLNLNHMSGNLMHKHKQKDGVLL